MTRHPHLSPDPFLLEGGPVGVVLIHGFTGAPPEMRKLGDYLNQRGLSVSGPLMPGHGTSVEEMNCCKWTAWPDHVRDSLQDLEKRCETVFVAGLSMGAVLALYTAATRADLPGIVLYSPAVWPANRLIYLSPVFGKLLPTIEKSGKGDLTDPQADLEIWSYEKYPASAGYEFFKLLLRTRRLLNQVTCPVLVIHSTGDEAIHPNSARNTYNRVSSQDKQLVTLHNSGHVITVDSEWEDVAERTYLFISNHLPEGVTI